MTQMTDLEVEAAISELRECRRAMEHLDHRMVALQRKLDADGVTWADRPPVGFVWRRAVIQHKGGQ